MVGRIVFGVECRVVEPDTHDAGAVGRRVERRAAVPRQLDRRRRTTTTRAPARASPTTAGCAPATSQRWTTSGRIRLVDRTKDLIKSGGEWISSVELENELMAHPQIKEAAVIGVPAPEVVGAPAGVRGARGRRDADRGTRSSTSSSTKVAKWQLPDDVVFIDEVPKTSVGKFSKKTLRDRFADYVLPG